MRRIPAVLLVFLLTALSASVAFSTSRSGYGSRRGDDQDWAKQNLNKSSRHQEWVTVKNGNRTVKCFIVYPEVKKKAAAVLVIHEIFGLTDWVESVADQLAAHGYIAIAPDLLSGTGPGGGDTSAFPDQQDAIKAIGKLPPDQITGDLNAAADYVKKLPSCSGKLTVAGFCWGGGQTFRFATNRGDLKSAFSFYGPPPDPESMKRINCPVYGFYAGNDNRIDSMIPKAKDDMKAAGKKYDPVTYDGAGHGFMRAGEDPGNSNPANKTAHDQAWERWMAAMKKV